MIVGNEYLECIMIPTYPYLCRGDDIPFREPVVPRKSLAHSMSMFTCKHDSYGSTYPEFLYGAKMFRLKACVPLVYKR